MKLFRYGSRPHSAGGRLHEFDVAGLLLVTTGAWYDEDPGGAAWVGVQTRRWWLGVSLAVDRVAFFVPWGFAAIATADPGTFDELYPEREAA